MGQEYVITGVPEELKEILVEDFQLSSDEARFMTAFLISHQLNEEDVLSQNEMELWYLENPVAENRTPVFNSRYSISFTDFGIKLFKNACIAFGPSIFKKGFNCVDFILKCLLALYESYHHISDMECCVYFTAIKWKKEHSGQCFSVDNIAGELKDECIYLDGKWECPFRSGDYCQINKENIQKNLNLLCEHNVMEQKECLYDFVK